jgi:hypothetical protein
MERMSKMIEALKARAEKAHRKPLTPEEIRERLHNSEFFKRLKEAQEKKLNAIKMDEE